MVCVFFEVLPKPLLANVWLLSVLEMWKIRPWCPHRRRCSRALQADLQLLHGSRILRYGLWRSWGRSAWSAVWSDSCIGFFSFISLSPSARMCPSVCASSTLIHADIRPDLRQETYVGHQKEKKLFIRGLQNEMSNGVFPTTRFYSANFNAPAL